MGIARLIQRSPVTIGPDATVMEATKLMTDQRVGAVAVTEDAKLVGIFTERDVMRKIVLPGLDPSKTLVAQVMTIDLKKIPDGVSVQRAVDIMRKHHIRHLPVVNDKDQLLGMVSLRYLLYDIVEDLEKQAVSLESYMAADGIGG